MEEGSRFEIVVTFLAMLELMKAGRITIVQDERFADIYIEAAEDRKAMTSEELEAITEYE